MFMNDAFEYKLEYVDVLESKSRDGKGGNNPRKCSTIIDRK